jgi:two-component system, OmpR family, sensor histidine kinase KdpD
MRRPWLPWVAAAIAVAAFLVLDFFFLPPPGTFALAKPVQWLLLPLFLLISIVAARLYERQRGRTELARQMAIKDAVLATMSHDLRTPLTTIKAMAHDLAADGDERAMLIEEEAERLSVLVTDMLELSRLNSGARAVAPEPNEAEDLLGAALQRIAGATNGHRIRVSLHEGEPLLFGRFDFTQTLRALVNLIENAVKHSPQDQYIEINVRREPRWLAFSVLDRGAGVPPEERERIFEPFYRGLGLSIARAVAEAQSGSLRYETREGGGSVFTLRVPAMDVEDVASG